MIHNENIGDKNLKEKINNNSAFYYMRCTPFTAHGEYNYFGELTETFFYDNLFSKSGKYDEYFNKIVRRLNGNSPKSIILVGSQGCGKTTFVNSLKRDLPDYNINIIDFDRNTSNPKLREYIELLSSYLLELLKKDLDNKSKVNNILFSLYKNNRELIISKTNAKGNMETFFEYFEKIFILKENGNYNSSTFINFINKLYLNQILSIIVLWHVSQFVLYNKTEMVTLCFDNLDVLVNNQIINGFFKDYFLFVRNIDDILQNTNGTIVNNKRINYTEYFTFIFSMRSITWAKIKDTYIHESNVITLSTLRITVTNAFDKKKIFDKRYNYIVNNKQDLINVYTEVECVKELLNDFEGKHNIYDLFNDDYRQCSITFEELAYDNPNLLDSYHKLVNDSRLKYKNGAKGLIYKALFDKFRDEDIFNKIGVLNVKRKNPLVSNARIILNYLDSYTDFSSDNTISQGIPYNDLVAELDGIISKNDISNSLLNMFKLGIDSSWNDLVGFDEIQTDNLISFKKSKVFITKAGHAYLDLVSTHFEFFNSRTNKTNGLTNIPLFAEESLEYNVNTRKYNFEYVIERVIKIVEQCCKNMEDFYTNYMKDRYKNKNDYLQSPFVFMPENNKVFHGERIIHTHLKYIDQFRLYAIQRIENKSYAKEINTKLLNYMQQYIEIGQSHPLVLSDTSLKIYPEFCKNIDHLLNKPDDFYTEVIYIKKTN